MSFVSFKLTVHNEFFNSFIDQAFWPAGIKASDFVVRPPESRAKSNIEKLRVDPFAVRAPRQNSPNSHMPKPNLANGGMKPVQFDENQFK